MCCVFQKPRIPSQALGIDLDPVPPMKDSSLFTLQNARATTECVPECRKSHVVYSRHALWNNCSESDMDEISTLQKRAARMILDVFTVKLQKENTPPPSAELFKELNWLTFQQNAHFRQAQVIHKSLNNLAPPYMRNLFKYTHEVIPRHLRSVSDNKHIHIHGSRTL